MKHNNISKLTILTCLFIGTISNAQNFYTCVPKDDWFNKRFDTRMLYEKFETAKTQINNDNAWEYLEGNRTSGRLARGIYRVIVRGGDGGSSGRSQNGGDGGKGGSGNHGYMGLKDSGSRTNGGEGGIGAFHSANSGGSGEEKREVFLITETRSYSACFGRKGGDGHDGRAGKGGKGGWGGYVKGGFRRGGAGGGGGGGRAAPGGQGGSGAGGYFYMSGVKEISVSGGRGGVPALAHDGKGGAGNYTIDPRTSSSAGSGGNDYLLNVLSYNEVSGCNAGESGTQPLWDSAGFEGGRHGQGYFSYGSANQGLIASGGDYPAEDGERGGGGYYGYPGSGGALMSSGESSNAGDGYVYIYKYKG